MAIIAKTTAGALENSNRDKSSLDVVQVSHLANTSATIVYIQAPITGSLKAAEIQASITSDGTKTYTVVLTNVSTAKTMSTTTLFDADPVLTAGTKATVNLSTTAANIACSRGDLIGVSMAGGTGSGLTATSLYFDGV